MGSNLEKLIQAKEYSDVKDYPKKVAILRSLIKESPLDFYIDSQEGNIVGVTHRPTGFRIHMPYSAYPVQNSKEFADDLAVYTADPPGKDMSDEDLEDAEVKDTQDTLPELNQWLHGVESEAKTRGYPNLFIAASDPNHPLGGGSVLRTGDTKDSELFHRLRAALIGWEKEKGLDPDHDWRKTSIITPEGRIPSKYVEKISTELHSRMLNKWAKNQEVSKKR